MLRFLAACYGADDGAGGRCDGCGGRGSGLFGLVEVAGRRGLFGRGEGLLFGCLADGVGFHGDGFVAVAVVVYSGVGSAVGELAGSVGVALLLVARLGRAFADGQ